MTDGKKLITQVASHDNNLTKTEKKPNINLLYLTFISRWRELAATLAVSEDAFFFFIVLFDVKYCSIEAELK